MVGDKICLQSQSSWGPYMPAILVQKGTKYVCNVVCLNSFLAQDDHFQGILKNFDISFGDFLHLNSDLPRVRTLEKIWMSNFYIDLHLLQKLMSILVHLNGMQRFWSLTFSFLSYRRFDCQTLMKVNDVTINMTSYFDWSSSRRF